MGDVFIETERRDEADVIRAAELLDPDSRAALAKYARELRAEMEAGE